MTTGSYCTSLPMFSALLSPTSMLVLWECNLRNYLFKRCLYRPAHLLAFEPLAHVSFIVYYHGKG